MAHGSRCRATVGAGKPTEVGLADCNRRPTRHFVHQLINWELVRFRLGRYPEIDSAFPESKLKEWSDKPPFYCHYMAWRLGTWKTEGHFVNLESLLRQARKLRNWENERPLLTNGEYGTFWSLVWQMQVAARLREVGDDVRWGGPCGGPDLSVRIDGQRWFVECCSVQKSYGLLGFLQDCLSKVLGVSVQCDYTHFAQMSLPKGSNIGGFLDSHLTPFCCPAYRDRAQQRYVEVVYDGRRNIRVLVQDWDEDGDVSNLAAGSPRNHVATMLREAVNNKKGRNRLSDNRPNVLAVNLLLTDAAGAHFLRPNIIQEVAPDLSNTGIDVLAASWGTGIDARRARLVTASARTAERREGVKWLAM